MGNVFGYFVSWNFNDEPSQSRGVLPLAIRTSHRAYFYLFRRKCGEWIAACKTVEISNKNILFFYLTTIDIFRK